MNDAQKHHLGYWTAFRNYIERRGSLITPTKSQPPDKYWIGFKTGRSGFEFGAHNLILKKEISVELYLSSPDARLYFQILHYDKVQIEREIGSRLEWQEKPTKKHSRIIIRNQSDIDPTNKQDWPRQHEWLLDKLEAFHKAFVPRIRATS